MYQCLCKYWSKAPRQGSQVHSLQSQSWDAMSSRWPDHPTWHPNAVFLNSQHDQEHTETIPANGKGTVKSPPGSPPATIKSCQASPNSSRHLWRSPWEQWLFSLLSPQARTMLPQHQGYHCHVKWLTAGWTLHFPPSCLLQNPCSRNLQNKKSGNIPWHPLTSPGLLFCRFLLQGLCRR